MLALLAALGPVSGAVAQEPSMHTLGIEIKGDTMIYRNIDVPRRHLRGPHARAWADYSHAPWTPEQKLFALSKFWMETRRNFAYMDRFGAERWDSLYMSLIGPAQQTRDDAAFYRLLQRFCAQLRNEQTFVRQSRDFPQSAVFFDDGWVLRLMDVGGRVTVSEVSREKADLVPPGSEVLEVDGQQVEARVADVKADGKLDLSVRGRIPEQMDADAQQIMERIEKNGGALPFTDKADPERIKMEFGMSKAAFKRAVGRLLKQRKITIDENQGKILQSR